MRVGLRYGGVAAINDFRFVIAINQLVLYLSQLLTKLWTDSVELYLRKNGLKCRANEEEEIVRVNTIRFKVILLCVCDRLC